MEQPVEGRPTAPGPQSPSHPISLPSPAPSSRKPSSSHAWLVLRDHLHSFGLCLSPRWTALPVIVQPGGSQACRTLHKSPGDWGLLGFPGVASGNLPANAGDTGDVGSIPGSRRSPGGGNGNPLQYFCPESPRDGGAWQAAVHGVTQSRA